MLVINYGYKNKYNGFIISLDYTSIIKTCIILGLFKRWSWHFDKKNFCFGFLYANFGFITGQTRSKKSC